MDCSVIIKTYYSLQLKETTMTIEELIDFLLVEANRHEKVAEVLKQTCDYLNEYTKDSQQQKPCVDDSHEHISE